MCADSDNRKAFPSLKLYIILDESLISGDRRNVLETIIQGGADAVQYRAKRLSKRRYYEHIVSLLPIARQNNIPLFVNDYLDIALAVSADGIHLGQTDLPCKAARRIVPPQMMLGVSTHSLAEAIKAKSEGADYVAIGSVFPTTTKENPEAIVGIGMVSAAKQEIGKIPLIAIGGINADSAASVIRAGADGIAVVSAVLRAADTYAAVKELKDVILAAQAS